MPFLPFYAYLCLINFIIIKKMNKLLKKFLFIFGVSLAIGLSSCEKNILDDNSTSGTGQLTIVTRGEDDANGEGVLQAQSYIFNQAGECMQILAMEGENNTATVSLAPGTYTLYSVGGNDLSRFTLPTLSNAKPVSAITLRDGKVMDSFFTANSTSATVKEAENTTANIALNHAVTCLNKIEIKDVPTEITAIEVKLSPFYYAIQLDGTFQSSPNVECRVPLTKQSDGTTWKAETKHILFPSIGNPTVSILSTTESGTDTYFYTLSEPMIANHRYNLTGTYKSSQSSLSVTITATDWGEDKNIGFEFKDTDTQYRPVAGQYCNGYYVVSVDEQAHKAVLLSEKIPYNAPADNVDASLWKMELEARMEELEKPVYITSNWRLPTLQEVEIFTKDQNAVSFTDDGYSPICFCEDDKGNLVWAYTQKVNEVYQFQTSGTKTQFTRDIRLRPVIDITY